MQRMLVHAAERRKTAAPRRARRNRLTDRLKLTTARSAQLLVSVVVVVAPGKSRLPRMFCNELVVDEEDRVLLNPPETNV